jgi:alpha-tubulin suppressor-like RCC1 family protein/endonuclease/exonuclease/phosphatase family metal-dependent hydrolase
MGHTGTIRPVKAIRIFPPVAVLLLGLALILGAGPGRLDGSALLAPAAAAGAPTADPTTTPPPPLPTPAPQLATGGQTSCEVRADATAWCFGENSWGQLGNGTNRDSTRPVQVGGPEWSSISTSGATTCGVKLTTELFCWGMNTRGQLGLGAVTQRWTPQKVTGTDWRQVSAAWLHTCAIKGDGSLWCWGNNDRGELGLGNRTLKQSPAKVSSFTDWTSVSSGGWHTCGIRSNGLAYCWGRNDFGQLGTKNAVNYLTPAPVATSRGFTSIDASWSSTCGVTNVQEILCWGQNDQGQLGDTTTSVRNSPVPVAGGHQWTTVALGDAHACGLDLLGSLWCWGSNRYGQLGDGGQTPVRAPKRVLGSATYLTLDVGWMHTCGLTAESRVECWGNNEQGQLGRGDRANRAAPPGVRPIVPRRAARRLDQQTVITSFNVLGSNHTAPGGGALNYAPARIRTEWTANLLESSSADIVAFQELKADQYAQLQKTLAPTYAFYPATVDAGKVVWQSVMWDTSQWEFVSAVDITVPVIGTTRPNPMVRLRSKLTGRNIWVFNVHNSSKNTRERQRERNAAVKIELAKIKAQRAKKIPVVFLGDMNEREVVFCKVVRQTDLRAATGGYATKRKCVPPRTMHLDWIFASPEFKVHSAAFERTPRVTLITDHSVLTATTSIPGKS